MALHYVAELDALEEAKPSVFDVAGRSIGLIKSGEKLYAVRNVCPHKRAPVCRGLVRGTMLASAPDEFVFGLDKQILQCPWHGWEFDLETGATLCPTPGKLTLYPVTVQDRSIYLDL